MDYSLMIWLCQFIFKQNGKSLSQNEKIINQILLKVKNCYQNNNTITWFILMNIIGNKYDTKDIMWFYLHNVQKKAKLIHDFRRQDYDYLL